MHVQSTGQFASGAMSCLGAPLYMNEAKVLLALIAREYDMSLVRQHSVPLVPFCANSMPVRQARRSMWYMSKEHMSMTTLGMMMHRHRYCHTLSSEYDKQVCLYNVKISIARCMRHVCCFYSLAGTPQLERHDWNAQMLVHRVLLER